MNKKILFTDLDGTLLTDEKGICQENIDAITAMREAGNILAITTGRPLIGAKRLCKDLNLGNNCYILGYHGNICYDCEKDQVVNIESMDSDAVINLMKAADEAGIHVQAFHKDEILALREDYELEWYNRATHEDYHILENFEEIRQYDITKVLLIDTKDKCKLSAFENSYVEQASEKMDSFFSCPEYLEYVKKGSNKGTAIEYLANYLDIPMENTIATGDEQNDLQMLAKAHNGCCMINGCAAAKSISNYVTENDNNNGGVAEVIYKFILN